MSSPDLSTLERQRAHYKAVRERLNAGPPKPAPEPTPAPVPEPAPCEADPFPVHLFVPPPAAIRRHSPVPETRVDLVLRLVCERFGVSRDALVNSKNREPRVCWPRQIAMYLLRSLSSQPSWNMVGRWLGGMDHTTILHGMRKVKRSMEAEPSFARVMHQMQEEIDRSS